MKKLLVIAGTALLIFCGTAFAQGQSASNTKEQVKEAVKKSPFDWTVKFEKETVDFGTAQLNKPVTVEFNFTNISNKPLIIQNAQPSCGCTTPDWTKAPVLPGKDGTIKATYNSAILGPVNKTVFVNFEGIPQTLELHLIGKVEK
ncbi:MAG: DUF1573 domain-containing protein, partial [Chitinophagaceae bacterium]